MSRSRRPKAGSGRRRARTRAPSSARSTTPGSTTCRAGSARWAGWTPIATTSCRRSSWSSAAGSRRSTAPTSPAGCTASPRRQVRDFRRRAWVKHIFTPAPRRRSPTSCPTAGAARRRRSSARRSSACCRRCSAKMAEARRTAFVLFEIEGLSGEEIARIQSIPAQHGLDAAASRAPGVLRAGGEVSGGPGERRRNGERIARWRGRGDERARRRSAGRGDAHRPDRRRARAPARRSGRRAPTCRPRGRSGCCAAPSPTGRRRGESSACSCGSGTRPAGRRRCCCGWR